MFPASGTTLKIQLSRDLLVKRVWLKIKQLGLRRFWSMFPLVDRVAFWVVFFFL